MDRSRCKGRVSGTGRGGARDRLGAEHYHWQWRHCASAHVASHAFPGSSERGGALECGHRQEFARRCGGVLPHDGRAVPRVRNIYASAPDPPSSGRVHAPRCRPARAGARRGAWGGRGARASHRSADGSIATGRVRVTHRRGRQLRCSRAPRQHSASTPAASRASSASP